jgi:hypothetical protein
MKDRKSSTGPYITIETKTGRLMLVDAQGNPVPVAEREAYIEQMTLAELRMLVQSLFDLPASLFTQIDPAAH